MTFAKHPKTPPLATYEDDAYGWAMEQAALLRARRYDLIDVENVAEEVESLGKSQYDSLESAYRVILLHLLKWDHQPQRRLVSWEVSIQSHRMNAERILRRNPGLKSRVGEALSEAYAMARVEARGETGLPQATFPVECPYDLEAVMSREIVWSNDGPAT